MSDAAINVRMRPTHPCIFVREEILDEMDLSVSKAADIPGVRRATLSDLTNGKAAMSPEMALRIEKAFGVSMGTLLRMQAAFCQPRDARALQQHCRQALRAGWTFAAITDRPS